MTATEVREWPHAVARVVSFLDYERCREATAVAVAHPAIASLGPTACCPSPEMRTTGSTVHGSSDRGPGTVGDVARDHVLPGSLPVPVSWRDPLERPILRSCEHPPAPAAPHVASAAEFAASALELPSGVDAGDHSRAAVTGPHPGWHRARLRSWPRGIRPRGAAARQAGGGGGCESSARHLRTTWR
jgi:hypothetical protein